MSSGNPFSDPFLTEILGQPDAIRRAARGLNDQLDGLERLRDAGASARTLVFTGMGSSYHACHPAIYGRANAGTPALQVDTAELLHFRRAILDADPLVVAVSRSGKNAEVVRLATELRAAPPPPAVSVVPMRLLGWRLASDGGRAPGVLTRTTKVTSRE